MVACIFKDQFDSVKKTWVRTKEHSESLIAQSNSKSVENADLKAQIQDKVFVITSLKNDLRKQKGKEIVENAAQIPIATTIAPGMFKLDIEPISHRLKNNRDAHEDYLKKTIGNTDTIRGLVEHARKQNLSEPLLDSACRFTKHVHELLVYVSKTWPSLTKPSKKLVVVILMNKVKKVRFSEPLTSSSNVHKQVESSKTPDSNTPVLLSTGLKSSTSASRSQPTSNKKNDRISKTSSSNMKNKVEVQLRRANLSSNKKNHVKDPTCDTNVKYTMLNVKSELIYVKCKQCMFDANHDMCFLDFVNDVNVCSKSKSAKQSQQHNIWKPTGKVFTEIGYKWKPTGKLFTLVGTVRFGNDQIAKIMGYGDYQLGNVTILRVYYVEGLGHNLFSVGQFCDSDFDVAFWKSTCFIQNLNGVDLLSGSKDINFYSISLDDMLKTSLICLLSKASKTNSWLWHRRLSHLNFGTLNKLAKDGLARVAATPKAINIADSPVLTSIDQDAPSTSIQSTQEQEQSPIISQGAEESIKTPHFNDDPLHEVSTSQGSSSNVLPSHTSFELLGKWTKNHPIANVIGDLSRSVSTRKQLQTDVMWCYFDAFLTSVEPKTYKEAMLEPS
ncbi:retrovirus-related pol polyprotein from transposon TNT 1-94 [Tanacetum coccineum]